MAALDVAVAPAVRQMLRQVLADRPPIIVTHDVLDALLLADRVLVVEEGHVVEEGPTAELLARPRSAFAARIAGLNMVRGTLDGHGVRGADGSLIEGIADQPIAPGDPAVAVFRPSAVGVYRQPPGGSPRNVIGGHHHRARTVRRPDPRPDRPAQRRRHRERSRGARPGTRENGDLHGQGQRGRDLPLLTAGAYAVLIAFGFRCSFSRILALAVVLTSSSKSENSCRSFWKSSLGQAIAKAGEVVVTRAERSA